jgi:hypothetical protein
MTKGRRKAPLLLNGSGEAREWRITQVHERYGLRWK